MPRSTLITENNVHNWVGEAQFNRGLQYVHDGLIQPGTARGKLIRGWCLPRDNQPGSYYVWARLLGLRIREARCTCPLGKYGICPHVAAVLVHYLREPDLYRRSLWQRHFGIKPEPRESPSLQQVA
jgi:uncharacterized Zn finger protein